MSYLLYGLLLDFFQVMSGKILENDIPVFVVTFATQEMVLFKNAKTGEIIVGAEDKVEQVHYAAVITRVIEDLDNELTGGWKVVEVRRREYRPLRLSHPMNYTDGTKVIARIPMIFGFGLPSEKYMNVSPPLHYLSLSSNLSHIVMNIRLHLSDTFVRYTSRADGTWREEENRFETIQKLKRGYVKIRESHDSFVTQTSE